jgi:exosortase/archaeosortase family protein
VSLLALYYYPYPDNGLVAAQVDSYLAAYARATGAVVSLLNPGIAVDGTTIRSPSFSMQIVKGCDAMEINILLVSALVAFPMPVWRRLAAAVSAVGILFIFNLCRLCVLCWLGAHVPAWFDHVHQTLAPLLMVLCALLVLVLALHLHRVTSGSCLARKNSDPG